MKSDASEISSANEFECEIKFDLHMQLNADETWSANEKECKWDFIRKRVHLQMKLNAKKKFNFFFAFFGIQFHLQMHSISSANKIESKYNLMSKSTKPRQNACRWQFHLQMILQLWRIFISHLKGSAISPIWQSRAPLFCKTDLQKRLYSAKETYNFKEPLLMVATPYRPLLMGDMAWLPLVGSLKLYVSFAEYSLLCRSVLQKRGPCVIRGGSLSIAGALCRSR